MNRREFLKAAILASFATAMPSVVLGRDNEPVELPGINPDHEHGQVLNYLHKDDIPWATEEIIAAAREYLPRGTPFEIRMKTPSDYGRNHGVAWYTHPSKFKKDNEWKPFGPVFYDSLVDKNAANQQFAVKGYYLVGRFVA